MSETVSLHPIDTGLILLYAAATVVIGLRAARNAGAWGNDFLLGGRLLTLPMFVATLVSTWYGGILGVGEFSYRYGISNWFVLGLPYYFFGLVFALFLAGRIRTANHATIPDTLERAFGRPTALLGSFLTFILITPAPYILMVAFLIQMVFGLPLLPALIAATLVSAGYLLTGGFHSNLWTNVFQFVLMYVGFAVMVVFAVVRFGGYDFVASHVPPLHLTWHGGNSAQYIIVWFFIALWTLVDPSFHQRCAAARTPRTARNGILVSILFWFVFDALTSISGLYARAVLPQLANPALSYPLLAEQALPAGAKGIFYIAMLATIMSTLSSLTLIAGITIGRDIAGRMCGAADDSVFVKRWSRAGIVIASVISIVLCLLVPSVVNMWYTIGTAIIPGLLLPVVAGYYPRLLVRPRFAFAAMAAGWLVSTSCLFYGQAAAVGGVPAYPFGIEPMYPGLCASALAWEIGLSMNRPDRRTA